MTGSSASRTSRTGGSSSRLARNEQLQALCQRGLDRCRTGNWKEGLVDLSWLVQSNKIRSGMPSIAYSYLGYGMAKYHKKVADGVRLCRYAIKIEFYQTENYVNLARTCMLSATYRREAFEAVREGLKVDPDCIELHDLQTALGRRKPPVLPFLSRSNGLNRFLGSVRHALFSGGERPATLEFEEEPRPGSRPDRGRSDRSRPPKKGSDKSRPPRRASGSKS